MRERPPLRVMHLGRVPYADALELQRALARQRIAGELEDDVLMLLEHPPVVTLGRTAKARNLIASPDYLRERGVEVFEVERGGDVTFHGPGQLVGYPIVDLRRHKQDLHWYLRQLEEALIRAVGRYGIAGERNPAYTGVWTGGRKIASIGVHVSRGVTTHGFAVNVDNDLQPFEWIVPCGIDNVRMTSLYKETGRVDGMGCFRKRVAWRFAEAYGLRQRIVSVDKLRAPVASGVA